MVRYKDIAFGATIGVTAIMTLLLSVSSTGLMGKDQKMKDSLLSSAIYVFFAFYVIHAVVAMLFAGVLVKTLETTTRNHY